MGNKKKIGKQRRDKYYRLAKETGYRSRAAFKLIQLNRKFEFLQNSRVCIDLCAAPGGWMQVAKETMPVSSVVVGVDLFPIKPVSGCISLQEDITTDKCRVALQRSLQTWKADVILNDGAPNVGKNWLHDAYQQACLTLSALKVATHFLRAGGWFVTKIFRSRDYNSLLWVFKQLFKKVHATKPHSSRTESAEIFVVCQYYLAPDKLDARFLDPKHVFKELEGDAVSHLNVFHPERAKKARAEGYEDSDVHYPMPVSEFLASVDAITALQKATEIVIDDETVAADPLTTAELKECCKDIRVLGRKELKSLISWWKALRQQRAKAEQEIKQIVNGDSESKEAEEDVDEDDAETDAIDEQLMHLEKQQMLQSRRERKQANKQRKKLQTRMDLKMVLKGDEGPRLEESHLFSVMQVPGKTGIKRVLEQKPDVVAESDPDSDVEPEPKVVAYEVDGPEHLHSSGTHYTAEDSEEEKKEDEEDDDNRSIEEDLGIDSDEEGEKEEDEGDKVVQKKALLPNPLLKDLDFRSKHEKRIMKASLWFEKDVFRDIESDEEADVELEEMESTLRMKTNDIMRSNFKAMSKNMDEDENSDFENEQEIAWQEKDERGRKTKKRKNTKRNSDEELSEFDDEDESAAKKKKKKKDSTNNPKKDGFEIVPEKKSINSYKMNAESLALGTLMITSKKMKRDIVDASWNRYAFNEEDLPDWFVADEEKSRHQTRLVPEGLVKEYKKREEELNVRPIKKVLEAKARKRKHTLQRLEKTKKKVENIMENVDMSERERARQVRQLYKKAKGDKKPEVTYVVAKKHTAGKRMHRPPGIKGPYKVVDPRMKKDMRKRKLADKKKGKGKGKSQNKRMQNGQQRNARSNQQRGRKKI